MNYTKAIFLGYQQRKASHRSYGADREIVCLRGMEHGVLLGEPVL